VWGHLLRRGIGLHEEGPGNLGAIDVELTAEDLREIGTELSKLTVYGLRMDEANMAVVES